MLLSNEEWNKEILENIKKTGLILELVQNLESRIVSLETKIDRVLTQNGTQDVFLGKFQEQLAQHDLEIQKLEKSIDDLTKKFYRLLGVFSGLMVAVQFLINFIKG